MKGELFCGENCSGRRVLLRRVSQREGVSEGVRRLDSKLDKRERVPQKEGATERG